jgi:hypothetical protein
VCVTVLIDVGLPSSVCMDLVSSCYSCAHRKRLTARECLHHTWLAQHDEKMSCVKLCTDKLKKFIIRRKWQVGYMVVLNSVDKWNVGTFVQCCQICDPVFSSTDT